MARSRAAAAATQGPAAAGEDAQQEVTVLMIEQLPALLTMYQAEPMVVSPFLCSGRGGGLRGGVLLLGQLWGQLWLCPWACADYWEVGPCFKKQSQCWRVGGTVCVSHLECW